MTKRKKLKITEFLNENYRKLSRTNRTYKSLTPKEKKKIYNRIYREIKKQKISPDKFYKNLLQGYKFSRQKQKIKNKKLVNYVIKQNESLKNSINFYLQMQDDPYFLKKDFEKYGKTLNYFIKANFQNKEDRLFITNKLKHLSLEQKGALLKIITDRRGQDIRNFLYEIDERDPSIIAPTQRAIKFLKDLNNITPDDQITDLMERMEKKISKNFGELK